jgi:ribonuclease P protein component
MKGRRLKYFAVSAVVGEGVGKIGFMISKKISKKAVTRNQIKRKLSEAIGNKIPDGLKIVLLVKKNIVEAEMLDLRGNWEEIYEKIGS